jgi:hypothetical protein
MALAFVVALRAMPGGRADEQLADAEAGPAEQPVEPSTGLAASGI